MSHPTLTEHSETILAITAGAWHLVPRETKRAAQSRSHLPEKNRGASRKRIRELPITIDKLIAG